MRLTTKILLGCVVAAFIALGIAIAARSSGDKRLVAETRARIETLNAELRAIDRSPISRSERHRQRARIYELKRSAYDRAGMHQMAQLSQDMSRTERQQSER